MQQTTAHILMVRPASFGFNEETAANNVFQGTLDKTPGEIMAAAVAEFDAFVEILHGKGVDVTVIQDSKVPAKPDAIFPNNWFCTLHNGAVYTFPMYAPVRRLERRPEIIKQLEEKFRVEKIENWTEYENQGQILEGTGSLIFDHVHQLAFACLSPRTNATLTKKFCRTIGYEPVLFTSTDERGVEIYHTNVMLHIGADYAVVCLESIRNAAERENVLAQLSRGNKKIVDISLEQVRHYAGNMLQVTGCEGLLTVMSRKALDSLTDVQKADISQTSTILPVDIPVIETIGGGSARCMMAEIFLKRK